MSDVQRKKRPFDLRSVYAFILGGIIASEPGKGLRGSPADIHAAIELAHEWFVIEGDDLAHVCHMFNVEVPK